MPIQIVVKSNRLPAISKALRPAATEAIHAAGFRVEAKAKVRSRVDTGNMRNQTRNQPSGDLSTTITAGAPYSGFLNFGTRYIPADHWFDGPVHEETALLAKTLGDAVTAVCR